MQIELFSCTPVVEPERELASADEYPYILYVSTSAGRCSGIYYECKSAEGAALFCQRDDTRGSMMGVEWAYFWTEKKRLETACRQTYAAFIKGRKDNKKVADDRWEAELLASLGIRKIK